MKCQDLLLQSGSFWCSQADFYGTLATTDGYLSA